MDLFSRLPGEETGARHDSLVGKVVHARWGYNCTINTFCIVVRETEHTILLYPLKKELLSGDDTAGSERPILIAGNIDYLRNHPDTFRAQKRLRESGETYFSQRDRIFTLWDGQPHFYNSD